MSEWECSGDSIPFHDYNCPVHGKEQEGGEINIDNMPEDARGDDPPMLDTNEEIERLTQQVIDLENQVADLESQLDLQAALGAVHDALLEKLNEDAEGYGVQISFLIHAIRAMVCCPHEKERNTLGLIAIRAITDPEGDDDAPEA